MTHSGPATSVLVALDGSTFAERAVGPDVDGALAHAFAVEPPDLLVMGTRAPHGLRRLIFGSTAAAEAHRSPRPRRAAVILPA